MRRKPSEDPDAIVKKLKSTPDGLKYYKILRDADLDEQEEDDMMDDDEWYDDDI